MFKISKRVGIEVENFGIYDNFRKYIFKGHF